MGRALDYLRLGLGKNFRLSGRIGFGRQFKFRSLFRFSRRFSFGNHFAFRGRAFFRRLFGDRHVQSCLSLRGDIVCIRQCCFRLLQHLFDDRGRFHLL